MVNNTRKKENQMKNIVENNNEHLGTIEKYQKNNQQIFTKRKKCKNIKNNKKKWCVKKFPFCLVALAFGIQYATMKFNFRIVSDHNAHNN